MRGDPFLRFTYKLALNLGMIRAEMMARMSSRELTGWIAYDRVEPLPDSWQQSGLICALIFNAWFKGAAKSPQDFIPARRDPRGEQSAEEGMAYMQAIAEAFKAQRIQTGE